jgi:hypothetical protein
MGKIIIRFSGIIGLLAIGAMIFVGYQLHWTITWWYFVASIVAYSVTIIGLNIAVEEASGAHLFRWVLGCHLAFLLLVGGLYLNLPNLFVNLGLFAACITAGFALPFMLFTTEETVSINGILGFLALGAMVFIGYYLQWNIIWWYFIAAIVTYSIAIISLNVAKTRSLRLILGCHFAFLFLVGGFYLNLPKSFVEIGVFAAAVAAGVALPFMWPKAR